ncbi:MAG: peptidase T, partial [Pseudomonadota bacterium]
MRYAAVDTQSDAGSDSQPSTAIQLDLSRMLVAELEAMGAQDVRLTDYGTVLATVPGTAAGPTIGFCSHVDTAPQFHASGVKPRLHKAWDGSPITYPDAADLTLSPEDRPYLATKVGHDIVTASGATLLGADDKSGLAIIMTLAEDLLRTPNLRHGPMRIAFTADEEIGR